MNVIEACRLYLNKMVETAGPGMKVFLMDKETVSEWINEYPFERCFIIVLLYLL